MDELKSGKRKTPSSGWFEICKKEKNPTADQSLRMHSQCQSGGGLSFTRSSTVTTKTCISIREVFKKIWKFLMAFAIKLRTPPLMALISIHFLPPFFFCNWTLHIWNGFYTWSQPKLSFLKVLFYHIQPYSCSPQLLYVYNIKPKRCAKHVLSAREWF